MHQNLKIERELKMQHYLKKNWQLCSLVGFLQVSVWGMQAGVQLLLMQCFNAAIQLDFRGFLFWTGIDLMAWGLYFGLCFLLDWAQTYTIRKLNNQVRHDYYYTFLEKSYQEYHKQNTGEYLSWLTNNIKQIKNWHGTHFLTALVGSLKYFGVCSYYSHCIGCCWLQHWDQPH